MRRSGTLLLGLAALLMMARLFTGIYFTSESALAYFVLKPSPDLAIERYHMDGPRFDRATVLDDDEMDLAYGDLYRHVMAAAPGLASLLAVAGLLMALRRHG